MSGDKKQETDQAPPPPPTKEPPRPPPERDVHGNVPLRIEPEPNVRPYWE